MQIPHLAENPRILNGVVEVYEKLDGGNSQVRMYQGRILAGNRANFLTDKHTKFNWFKDFLKWASGNYSFFNLPENFIVYGEWLSKHTLDYFPENINQFYLIDIFDVDSKRFIQYQKSVDILESLGIEDVNFINPLFKGKISMHDLEKLVGKSNYRNGKMEGVVIKNYSLQQFAKLWESSLKRRKKIISDSDVRRVIFSMVESGIEITPEKVKSEIVSDLSRQRIPYLEKTIEKTINRYFSNQVNLF